MTAPLSDRIRKAQERLELAESNWIEATRKLNEEWSWRPLGPTRLTQGEQRRASERLREARGTLKTLEEEAQE